MEYSCAERGGVGLRGFSAQDGKVNAKASAAATTSDKAEGAGERREGGIRIDYPLEDAAQAKESGLDGMTMLIYSALLTLALMISAPWWLLRMGTTERYREGLRQRLGGVPAQLKAAVRGKQVVWIHAVSVGEVLAASRLVGELETALGEGWGVVISTTTRTGQALARERFGAARVFYMPLDFAFAIRPYLAAMKPAAMILMESELWPRMLHECERKGIRVAVVNARMSDRSFRRAMRVRAVWARVMQKPALWLAQSEEDARRLVSVGVRAKCVQVVGNLKYDIRAPKKSRIAELILEAARGRPIVVAGSTVRSTESGVDSEEAQVIHAWMRGVPASNAMLVIAPRHPERFGEVWEMVFDFPALRATELPAGRRRESAVQRNYPDGESLETMDIVLLDTIGDLAAVYGIADVAYVGGSMMKRGGHNPLEPAQFGVPVVMGSSYENFREIVGKMVDANAIRIVNDEAELEIALAELIENRGPAKAMGERGRRVFEEQQGATGCSVEALVAMIDGAKR
jgi:3-deoxy-D-manno-octulosonic-acid transferase